MVELFTNSAVDLVEVFTQPTIIGDKDFLFLCSTKTLFMSVVIDRNSTPFKIPLCKFDYGCKPIAYDIITGS